jgi:NAD(P)-dependent dehydrogenase (short-subunit alcohol dehydrogenase family)
VLNGRVVLITGAARGIGAATARAVAATGGRVALLGLEPELLAELAAELGPRHAWFECDVTDREAVERAVAATVETLGGIDVVVANAGIANHGTVAVTPTEALTRTIEVNLVGVVHTVAAALPHVTARRGYLLLVSSAAAFTAMPGMAAYCASKAGVEQFGNVLRLEVAHKRVSVGIAHMTWIDTDLVRDMKEDLPSFRDTIAKLPGPLGAYTSVEACASAFLRAIERRSRRVFVPRSLIWVEALRPLLLGPLGEASVRGMAAKAVPELEANVRRLGRSFGRHSVG